MRERAFSASKASLRKNAYALPRGSLPPACVTTLMMPPEARPNSAMPPARTTENSRMTSWLKNVPARSAASSFAERPSTIKEFARLRCVEMETPVPGTAEVSAKRWATPVLVREAPGASRASSR